MKYFKLYNDDTCKFLEGITRKSSELKGASLKGGQIWKTLENSELAKIRNPEEGGDIEVKIVKKKKRVKKKGEKEKIHW